MSISVNELKPKTFFIFEGEPYVVLETKHLKMQQRRPTVYTKMRNLKNGKILERNFSQSDTFQEADIKRQKVKYLYGHREQYWFSEENNPSKRFQLSDELLGDSVKFLKPNTIMDAIIFKDEIVNIELPIKVDLKVIEAPPAVRGDTAQGGIKQVKVETGASINVPLFINEGDVVRVNTQTEEYTERVEKEK